MKMGKKSLVPITPITGHLVNPSLCMVCVEFKELLDIWHTLIDYSQTINLNSDAKTQESSSWITALVNKYQIG